MFFLSGRNKILFHQISDYLELCKIVIESFKTAT